METVALMLTGSMVMMGMAVVPTSGAMMILSIFFLLFTSSSIFNVRFSPA